MGLIRKSTIHLSLRLLGLLGLSVLPIGLGIIKLYSHYNSRFRSDPFDYLVAAGLILGGVFLFFRKPSKVILLISSSFIIVEVFKAIVDHGDLFDVMLAIVAIIYLSIPLLRYILERVKSVS